MSAYWFGRLNVALCIGVLATVAAFGTGTMLHWAVLMSGAAGFWCVLVLACLACLAVLDVIINDLLPECFTLKIVKRNRHLIYMALGIGTASLGFVIQQTSGLNAMHGLIFLNSFSAVSVAFLDLYARHKES